MSEPGFNSSGLGSIGEAPENDAEHAEMMHGCAMDLSGLAERFRMHREELESKINMAPEVLAGLDEAAEHISDAGTALHQHISRYMETYSGVRETADATGGKIPGMDTNSRYWEVTA